MARLPFFTQIGLDPEQTLTFLNVKVLYCINCRVGFVDEASLKDGFAVCVKKDQAGKCAIGIFRVVDKVLNTDFSDLCARRMD